MVENGLVDLEFVLDTFQYLVVRDWQVFAPHAEFVISQYKVPFNAWGRFEWLTEQAKEPHEREHASPAKKPKAAKDT